jgi:hypothetical protein
MIDLPELLAVSDFIEARSQSSSARCIEDWCEARDVDSKAVLRFAGAIVRSTLETIAQEEAERGEIAATEVEAAFIAATVTALQVGVDAERRRRDQRELPA